MPRGKHKGIVYSLITLLLVVPILLYLITYQEAAGSRDELASLKIRGIEISNFANSISQDVPRIFAITSKRALISAVNEIDVDGTALNNSQAGIVELMYNATIYNKSSQFMAGSSLLDWASRMSAQGRRFGFDTNITILYLNVAPYDSFNLQFSLLLFVNATDTDGIVSIVRTYNESYILPLEGMEDVLYPLNTNGFIKRLIKRANFTVYGSWSVDQAITQEVYMGTDDGGSFLDRMEGKNYLQGKYAALSPRVIGLESFVNLQKIAAVGHPTKGNQTIIDHLYFNSSVFGGCDVTNSSYSWFKLDYPHNATYNVSTAAC
ncbi:MAG: hypothetical protein AABX01_06160 [Candidatus Micrarchaeota archaeon]